MNAPCRRCNARTMTCHIYCTSYQRFRNKIDELHRLKENASKPTISIPELSVGKTMREIINAK
jgi:hypothetical protein